MADTWRENAIVEAILIIADKKIAQAGYDKTIKGVINKVIDKTKGKYQVRYQDSLFEAFSTSAKVEYIKDQLVSVLIPGNDWDRVKTILGGVDIKATNYQQVPVASLNYNRIGTSGTSLKKNIELSSYVGNTGAIKDLVTEGYITLNNTTNFINYVKRGNGIALGMKVRTALADGQIGGDYGLRFYLKFGDNVTGNEVIKEFTVSTKDVIGQPYLLTSDTIVLTLIKDVDILNFKGISSIEAYCTGFPGNIDKIDINDIFISDVFINGASVLSDLDLNGYILHIDYSEKGNIIGSDLTTIPVVALLKINGKITTLDVEYYWFRLNGTVFKGDLSKYSGFAGDGWECLNYWTGTSFVPKTNGKFNFNSSADNFKKNTALAPQKVTKILCVAIYNNKEWVRGLALIINNNRKDVVIESSDLIGDEYQIDYFLDKGSPNLTCQVKNINGSNDNNSNYTYVWSITPARGSIITKQSSSDTEDKYLSAKNTYDKVQKTLASIVGKTDKDTYKNTTTYKNAISNWNGKNGYETKEYIYKNKYYNFPIKSINNYSKISCAVKNGNTYIGTGSIVLYNKLTLLGMYSLNINNGVQIFQYDEKGNSPFTKEIDRKPLDNIPPLGFTLLDKDGNKVSYSQITKDGNGYVKWLFPAYDTLLISNLGTPDFRYDSIVRKSIDKNGNNVDIAIAEDLYNIYNNKETFSYSIEDRYTQSKTNNTIKLIVKFKDIILLAYTDLTFPKNGDPGTNGTDLIAKIVPATTTDRVYVTNIGGSIGTSSNHFYDDTGAKFTSLSFNIYNNNNVVYSTPNLWTCPPMNYNSTVTTHRGNTFIDNVNGKTTATVSPTLNTSVVNTISAIKNYKPVNIVRAKKTITTSATNNTTSAIPSVDYIAEYPLNYVYLTNSDYRIKIKPKSGFKYVVYAEDGTRPDYDNQPFLIIVEKKETVNGSSFFSTLNVKNITCTWDVIGGIEKDNNKNSSMGYTNNSPILYFKPSLSYNGEDLTTAILASVKAVLDNNSSQTTIGVIHIPIYKLINRYGHSAINGWDGNSIELNNDDGIILAPQVGAGSKNTSNQFNGVLIGSVKTGNKIENGLFGYNNGQRSIFLDALNGNATFGKQGAAQIKITASSGEGTIQSGDYNYKTTDHTGTGLKIKFSSTGTGNEKGPYIRYGSNKFSVSADGSIHAAGSGDIAGWNITDSTLYKSNVGLNSNTNNTSYNPNTVPNDTSLATNNGNMAIWAGTGSGNLAKNFYVTHSGYLYSKSGKIAKWNIDANRLTDGNVGMGLMTSNDYIAANTFEKQPNQITNGRFWSNKKFVVDDDGKLWSKSAQIASWTVDKNNITNDYTGMGNNKVVAANTFYAQSTAFNARFWSGTSNSAINFAVSSDGYLYAQNGGSIGGWKINKQTLSSDGITIDSTKTSGSIYTSNYSANSSTGWKINSGGSAYFQLVYANKNGSIAGWTISPSALTSPESNGHSIRIGSDGAITSYDAASTNGWSITRAGSATFKNLTANGTGQIGGWKISSTTLSSTTSTNHLTMDSSGNISGGRIDKENNAYWKIDKDGSAVFNNLTANGTGLIAGWDINNKALTNGNVGLGENIITIADMNSAFGTGTVDSNVTGRFWGLNTANQNSTANFVVDNKGYLYSRKGQIGGWTINDSSLKSGGLEIKSTSTGGLITAGDSSGNNYWNINHDGSATFKNLTANGTGHIGGWEIGNTTLKGGELTLNSAGSMSGPGWSIDANGNASFSNGQGSFAAGGGSGVIGGVSIPSSGGGSWGGPGGVSMNAKNITLYTRLGLAKTSFSAVGDGKAHIAAQMTSIKNAVKIKEGSKTVTGTVTGTVDGKSISNGRCSISVPTYLLEYDDTASVPIRVVDIGSVIVTGWNKTDTFTANFLCSADPNQRFEDS